MDPPDKRQLQQNVQASGTNHGDGIVINDIVQMIAETFNTLHISPLDQVVTSEPQTTAGVESTPMHRVDCEHQMIWHGLLEWVENPINPSIDPQIITKNIHCLIAAKIKNGEPELMSNGWPTKLIMQLIPKQMIGAVGGVYMKNSKVVFLDAHDCEALRSLSKIMCLGFTGIVHFVNAAPTCDIRILILFYTETHHAFLGFIPNDQSTFINRLRSFIQQQ